MVNGNQHHFGLTQEQRRKQQLEQSAQRIVQEVIGIVEPGSQAALIVKGPPHRGAQAHAIFATMQPDAIIATAREMARVNNIPLDLDTQAPGNPGEKPLRERVEQAQALAENLMNKVRRALMLLPVTPANAAGIRNLRQALGVEQFVKQPEAVDDADQLLKAMLGERIVQDTEQTRQGIEVVMNVMGQWEDATAARVAAGMSEPVARRLTQACGLYGLLMHIGSLTERLDGFLAQIGDQHHAQLDG